MGVPDLLFSQVVVPSSSEKPGVSDCCCVLQAAQASVWLASCPLWLQQKEEPLCWGKLRPWLLEEAACQDLCGDQHQTLYLIPQRGPGTPTREDPQRPPGHLALCEAGRSQQGAPAPSAGTCFWKQIPCCQGCVASLTHWPFV